MCAVLGRCLGHPHGKAQEWWPPPLLGEHIFSFFWHHILIGDTYDTEPYIWGREP